MASSITAHSVPPFTSSVLSTLVTRIGHVARYRSIVITSIGLLAFLGSSSVGLLLGISEPQVHDEFSYLLAADTFAHGRLTNPTHPMWIHFESFHVIHQPTYMSKYPPAQGLALAAGQVIGGHPIVGVWVSIGLMCAAICWMLYAWVPPRWAVLGGILALIHPALGIAGYWAQSYWGGAVAATGGALVLGGIRRLMREPRVHNSLLTGAGLAILANSRPFEGLLVSLVAVVFLLNRMVRQRDQTLWFLAGRVGAPIVLVLTLTIAAMGFYNQSLTGHPLRIPYQIHEATYGMAPLFLWQKLPPEPEYRHKLIQDFHTSYALPLYTNQRSIPGFLSEGVSQLMLQSLLAVNVLAIPIISIVSVLVPWMLRNRWARRALFIYLILVLGLLGETFKWLHYSAPIICLNYYIALNALRLAQWRNRRVGHLMLWLTPILAVAAVVMSLYGSAKEKSSSWHMQRARLLKELKQEDGKHLVIVSYGPQHSSHQEWVYNEADIDNAKVIWARSMDEDRNRKLVEYFKERHVWMLEPGIDGVISPLKPYPKSAPS